MEQVTSGRQILGLFFPQIRSQRDIQNLWNGCPNQMLWEAIKASDAKIVTWQDILRLLRKTSFVYAFPEPLPSLYLGAEPAYSVFRTEEVLARATHLTGASTSNEEGYNGFTIEPLYLICADCSWMIALTTENTPSGDQLCALLPRQVMQDS